MAEEYGKWISVKERFPAESGEYLCWLVIDAEGGYDTCPFSDGKFWCYGDSTKYVTHWQALPDPPTAELGVRGEGPKGIVDGNGTLKSKKGFRVEERNRDHEPRRRWNDYQGRLRGAFPQSAEALPELRQLRSR